MKQRIYIIYLISAIAMLILTFNLIAHTQLFSAFDEDINPRVYVSGKVSENIEVNKARQYQGFTNGFVNVLDINNLNPKETINISLVFPFENLEYNQEYLIDMNFNMNIVTDGVSKIEVFTTQTPPIQSYDESKNLYISNVTSSQVDEVIQVSDQNYNHSLQLDTKANEKGVSYIVINIIASGSSDLYIEYGTTILQSEGKVYGN